MAADSRLRGPRAMLEAAELPERLQDVDRYCLDNRAKSVRDLMEAPPPHGSVAALRFLRHALRLATGKFFLGRRRQATHEFLWQLRQGGSTHSFLER